MLLPLSSHWPRELLEVDGESQFNTHVSDIALSYYGSASVRPMLVPTRPKPADEDSFSPPQVLSDSTFSLLSRKYSPSTTESSCESSEASSVDENFLCGSDSPMLGPTNWGESSGHSNGDLSADGDEKSFSLLGFAPDLSMVAGMPGTKQPHGDAVGAEVETVTEAASREPAELQGNFDLTLRETKDTALILAAPTTTDITNSSSESPATRSLTQSDSTSLFSSSETPVSRPRQSSLSSSTHTCSTCHLYAPSSSVTFYLDAWLNQQNDIHPSSVSEFKAKSKKRVSWPDTTAELRNVIVVDKWIEKGVHVHPQTRPRSERYDDSDDDSDDEPECQQSKACGNEEETVNLRSKEEKQVVKVVPEAQVQAQQQAPLPQKSHSSIAGLSKGSDCDTVGSSASLRLHADAADDTQRKQEITISSIRSNKVLVQMQRKTEAPVVKRPSPPSSVSSSSSSSSSPSSRPQQQRVMKPSKLVDTKFSRSSIPRVVTQLPAPKKKFSSGVTVKIIGGPYSEHEAAMKIRGVDPIKHRAMIENYWQF